MLNKTLILLSVTLCFSCAKPYYGYSKQDWDKLPVEQQRIIKAEFQPIIDSTRLQAHKNMMQKRKQSLIDLGVRKNRVDLR